VEINHDAIYSRNKRVIIITGILLLVITSPLNLFFDEKSLQIVDLLTVIGFNILIFAWCHYDSLERNEPFGAGWRLLIIILGIFALFIYLLKTRGFKQGLISIGKTLLILLLAIVVAGITTTLIMLIKQAIQS
jgi:hypothetical protein